MGEHKNTHRHIFKQNHRIKFTKKHTQWKKKKFATQRSFNPKMKSYYFLIFLYLSYCFRLIAKYRSIFFFFSFLYQSSFFLYLSIFQRPLLRRTGNRREIPQPGHTQEVERVWVCNHSQGMLHWILTQILYHGILKWARINLGNLF